MKKFVAFMMIMVFGLAACGGEEVSFSVAEKPSYKQGETSEITVQAEKDGEPVEALEMSGLMEMEKMDHGVIEINFADNGDGTYTGEVELPMSGEWILDLSAGDSEKILTFEVSEG